MKKWLFLLLLPGIYCSAKNLDGRLGFGFDYQDFNKTPALSFRYHFSQYISSTFLFGFDTSSTAGVTILGMKLMRNAHIEENLNLYLGIGGFAVADNGGGATTTSGLEFDGFLGAEFFFPGLPNLGFMFEAGLAVRTLRTISSKSIGGGLATAGIHYYF